MPTIPQSDKQNGEERVAVTIRIPKSIDRAVEIEAAHRDVSKQQLMEESLRAFLQQSSKA